MALPERDAVAAFVALGANLGDAAATVRAAMQALGQLPHTSLVRGSGLYRSAPLLASGPDFINAVACIHTALSAPELLLQLQQLEQDFGRRRPYANAPRTLDLDLLLYGQGVIHSARLELPHPRMWQRAFVLLPLAEIAPELVGRPLLASVSGQTISRL